ncbi:MAG: hypothetical protein SFU98_22205 [Leptospiraceae bacterium]|nr:hypothetical protein [Leptospiraceae bacterium]
MILRITILLITITINFIGCGNKEETSKPADTALGLLIGAGQESSKDFILNGSWNSFTGNGTTSTTIVTYNAKSGTGVTLSDNALGSFYSLIADYSNANGTFIAQNPPNGGAFAPITVSGTTFTDTNKGKYFKTVFFKDGAAANTYWLCTLSATGSNTLAEANAIADTANRSNPGTTGCGGNFPWSRIVKR